MTRHFRPNLPNRSGDPNYKNAKRVAAGQKAAQTQKVNKQIAAVASVALSAVDIANNANITAQNADNKSTAALQGSQQALTQSSTSTSTADEESFSESSSYDSPTTYHHSPGGARNRAGCPTHILIMFGVIGMVVGAVVSIFGIYRNRYTTVKRDASGQQVEEVNVTNVLITIVIAILFAVIFALAACMLYDRYRG